MNVSKLVDILCLISAYFVNLQKAHSEVCLLETQSLQFLQDGARERARREEKKRRETRMTR